MCTYRNASLIAKRESGDPDRHIPRHLFEHFGVLGGLLPPRGAVEKGQFRGLVLRKFGMKRN